MFFTLNKTLDVILLAISLFILSGTIILTFKTRFVQFRMIPEMFKLLFQSFFKKKKQFTTDTIPAYKALFTAMSTSIGIGNIVSPIIAIKLGGPGALLGFLLAAIFGSASTFVEVTFALKYRKENLDGTISGGPMQYIKQVLPQSFSMLYAYAGFLTLVVWSSNQANALSDLLKPRGIPGYITGIILAITITYILLGGIQRVGNFSARLVPVMFLLYCFATLWIIIFNIEKLPSTINLIFRSAFTPKAIFGAGTAFGFHTAFRWGLAKGFFANEAGLGFPTIPHSMSQSKTPINQGILSMLSVYSNGFLCLLSGLTVLLTDTWLNSNLGIGINILAQSLKLYFGSIGIIILMLSALLFAFGTIVGNSYNGSQCFLYATQNQGLKYYYIFIALIIFIGSISEVETLAKITDLCLIPLAIPNVLGIILLAFKRYDLLKTNQIN
ncbi:amino acid carrier protein [Candidatus Dependentiae bacterium]|nr:amino acid carrier protein [Candidatus Dependentiae bacterium]